MLSSLLNSTNSDPVHASSPGSARLSSPGKQNSVPWSPSASRSPVKQSEATLDAHPHGKNAAAAASSASPSTPSRAALGNLIHATDQEPRATPTPNGDHTSTPTTTTAANHNNKDDLSSSEANGTEHKGNSSNTLEDGDITMDDAPDEELVEEAMRNTADMSDEGEGEGEGDGEDDDDDDDDDDDEDDDDEDSEDDGDDSDSSEIIVVDGPDGEAVADSSAVIRVKSEPADAGAAAAADGDKTMADEEGEVVNVLQPKKKGKRRARSESEDEDLPPPPPPMPTIRLEVTMNADEDTLDWNFAEHAAAAGYHITNAWGEDPRALGDVVMAEGAAGDDSPVPPASAPPDLAGPLPPGMSVDEAREMEEIARRLEAKYDKPSKRKMTKKRRMRVEYDLSDPFIDDSDLQIDAPTHVARPKKEGFFVHLGALELMEESPVKRKSHKPKAPKNAALAPRKSLSTAVREKLLAKGHTQHGSAQSPIAIDSDDETMPSLRVIKRSPSPEQSELDRYPVDRTLYKNASREPKYLPPFDEFPDDVRHYLMALRRESSKHVWDPHNKGKFPDHLKAPLKRAGEAAFQHDLLCTVDKEAQDSGFEKYQEKAFVTALCSILPYNRLTLGKLVLKLCYNDYWRWLQANESEGLRQWKEILDPEIPAMVQAYEDAMEAYKNATEDAPPEQIDELPEAGKKEREPPKKLPFFSPELRELYRQLVENTQEMVDINKKMEEWGQKIEGQSSELNMRRALYNKIGKLYPEGYMTSLTLSRQFTNFKRQAQAKQGAENGEK